ncbi:NEL-type E3 ubiquitin ligase domain-containing protein [Pseudomonas akapageensis]|uniref:NEL-type E3 ubiquitin ligase domain-containing protein n=1 Tax=Pseudomonas akapageensis TaxID=2609961 RepID=UPI001409CCD6|nr:DUF6543 domain-containing protein [Pseudomonas akapageensis]
MPSTSTNVNGTAATQSPAAGTLGAGPHDRFTQQRVPSWLAAASIEQRQTLRAAIARSERSKREVRQALAGWQGLKAFAEPLLAAALLREFGFVPDLASSIFFHVIRSSRAASSRPGPIRKVVRQSLLQAAMQNFGADETFDHGTELQSADGRSIAIGPDAFARLCRGLDLGLRYQEHLKRIFEPVSQPGDGVDSAQSNLRATLMHCQRNALLAQANLALLRGHLDQSAHDLLVTALHFRPAQGFKAYWLSLWGLALDEVLLFELPAPDGTEVQPCLLYIPGDSQGTFHQYTSRSAVMEVLRERLCKRRYQSFFSRFVGQRNRPAYWHEVEKRFNALRVTHGSVIQPLDVSKVRLNLEAHLISGNLLRRNYDRHVLRIKDDAQVLAVPTAQIDSQQRLERVQHWLDIGMNVLNAAALFVPTLGLIMLPVAGAQLLGDVFHGIEAWEADETDLALEYLTGVAQNLTLLVALGAVHAEPSVVAAGRFVGRLEAVTLPDGQVRLWKPDLSLYRSDVLRTPALRPNALGQYEVSGKTCVSMDGHLYEAAFDSRLKKWRIQHPTDPQAYQPLLEHNGMGAWHYVGEKPAQWPTLKLIRRLGYGFDDLPDDSLLALWRVSGVSEASLSRIHTSGLPTPAILLDVLEAYRPGQPLPHLQASSRQARLSGLLQRDFPGLTITGANELVDLSRSSERLRMLKTGRIALRLGEGARAYLQQSRLSQALLGFYFDELVNIDTLTLAVRQLEQLPGGTRDWHIDPSVSPGAQQQGLFSRLVEAMPESRRQLLKLEEADAAATLRRLLADKLVARRSDAAKMLGMQPLRPVFRALQRLSGGRLGYPLGGVVGRPLIDMDLRLQALFPSYSVARLHEFKAGLSLARIPLATEVSRLEQQLRELKGSLSAWVEQNGTDAVARRLLADKLVDCWQRNPLPGARAYAYEGYRLDISELEVGALPPIGEGFEHVTELALHDVALGDDGEAFLRGFTGVRALVLNQTGLTTIPEAVRNMSQLRELLLADNHIQLTTGAVASLRDLRFLHTLDLSGNGLSVTLEVLEQLALLRQLRSLNLAGNASLFPAGAFGPIAELTQLTKLYLSGNWIVLLPADVQALARLTELEILSLNDNPLGLAPDVSQMRHLVQLSLENTGLTQWPAGLAHLESLHAVNLSFNRLETVLPGMQRMWHINLDGNPLSAEALQDFVARGGNYRAGRSGSSVSSAEQVADISEWLQGATDEQRERWQEMQEQESAQPFFRVLQRLRDTAEHDPGSLASRQRVWGLLDAAADSHDLRERLYALARGEETCADRAALVFSQLEVERRVYDLRLEALPIEEHNERMANLARQLFRLDEVDIAARRIINQWRRAASGDNVDDIEVLLAFRIGLARSLELPDQPANALYLDLAEQVTPAMLDETAQLIRSREQTTALPQWGVQQDFWIEFLKSRYAADFEKAAQPWHLGLEYLDACLETANVLPANVSQEGLGVVAESLEMPLDSLYANGAVQKVAINDDQYLRAIHALNHSQQRSERELIGRLTEQVLKVTVNIPA